MAEFNIEFFALSVEKAKALQKVGVDFRAAFDNEPSLAYWSAAFHRPEVVSYLLSLKCDYSKPTKNGTTPMIAACRKDRSDIVVLLAENGVDPKKPDQTGLYPILAAASKRSIKTFETLLSMGVPINVHCPKGRSVAHYAAKSWTHYEIDRLHKMGVSFSECDKDGNTPLQYAEWHENVRAVSILRRITEGSKASKNDLEPLPEYGKMSMRSVEKATDHDRRQKTVDELLQKANRIADVRSRLELRGKSDKGKEK